MTKKILVIQVKHIGDSVATSLLFPRLKSAYGGAETHFMVIESARQVLMHNDAIDSFFVVDANRLNSPAYVWSIIKQIRAQRYDLVLDVYGKTFGNLVSYFSLAATRVGYLRKRSKWIYTHPIDITKQQLANEPTSLRDRKCFLQALDIQPEGAKPAIALRAEEIEEARTSLVQVGLKPKEKLFMVSVLGSGPTKSYPSSYMAKLLDQAVEKEPNIHLLMNYIPSQRRDVEKILSYTRSKTRERVHLGLYAKGIREFLGLLSQCSGMFGNEGGAINMAKALDIPTFAIYSPQINLDAWSGEKERAGRHPAVHLAMFRPDQFPVSKKDSSKQQLLYQMFTADLFANEFASFVRTHCASDEIATC